MSEMEKDMKLDAKAKSSLNNMGGGPGDMTWWMKILFITVDTKLSDHNIPLESNLH